MTREMSRQHVFIKSDISVVSVLSIFRLKEVVVHRIAVTCVLTGTQNAWR